MVSSTWPLLPFSVDCAGIIWANMSDPPLKYLDLWFISAAISDSNHYCHARSAVNDIIHRALSAAKIPSHLELTGLLRSDGKCLVTQQQSCGK